MPKRLQQFQFDRTGIEQIRNLSYGRNWPVVYILNNNKDAYVGETTSAYMRMKQHKANEKRKNIKQINLIYDSEFNKSAVLDLEALLINYMSADQKYTLQNATSGINPHVNYYEREKYLNKFDDIWKFLIKKGLANHNRFTLENLDIFKYSPYKTLTEDQYDTAMRIAKDLLENELQSRGSTFFVNGKPGTGKTVLAVYLMKFFNECQNMVNDYAFDNEDINFTNILQTMMRYPKDLKIGLVVPMESLRKTLKKVFRQIPGLKSNMVLKPSEIVKDKYDILIVDEAHRLFRRVNLMPSAYKSFDKINNDLNIEDGTQLDWIIHSSKHQIFFYDSNQSVRPSDVRKEDFERIINTPGTILYELTSQMRVQGGDYYINSIFKLLNHNLTDRIKVKDYDLKIFDNVDQMIQEIKEKDKVAGLCRVVAGYAWPWNTKNLSDVEIKKNKIFDIQIEGYKYIWNKTNKDWVNSKNAINEMGCIHSIQGYDLNYVGVIVGPEIKYNEQSKSIIIDANHYYDTNGKRSLKNEQELYDYIINIYKVLLTRGIKGTYIYVCDPSLRKYFKRYIVGE